MPRKPVKIRRRKPTQARSASLVDDVIEAAAQLLVEEGLDTTTNRISERAGVSVGSIYQYFPNKRAIFEAVAARHMDRLHALHDALSAELFTLPPDQVLPAAVRSMVALEQVNPALGSALNRLSDPGTRSVETVRIFEERMERTVAGYLTARTAAGDLDIDDPVLTAQILVRAIAGVVRVTLATDPALVQQTRFADEVLALAEGYLHRVG